MAQKVQVLVVCDLHEDEVEGTDTVSFGLDGTNYEIDVCDSHSVEMRDAFALYVGAARRASRPAAASSRRSSRAVAVAEDRRDVVEIRNWARSTGQPVSERGRLSAALVQAYEAAH